MGEKAHGVEKTRGCEWGTPVSEEPGSERLIAGRYAIVKKLNQGGMGAIYLAIQRPLDRPVARLENHRRHLAARMRTGVSNS